MVTTFGTPVDDVVVAPRVSGTTVVDGAGLVTRSASTAGNDHDVDDAAAKEDVVAEDGLDHDVTEETSDTCA